MNWPAMLADPVTRLILLAVLAILLVSTVVMAALSLSKTGSVALRRELWLRLASWLIILPMLLGPILAGKFVMIGGVTLLGLLCLREYDRATGLFREPLTVGVVALGIVAANFAAADNWYELFVALWPLTVSVIAIASIPSDRPSGYIQRTALAVFAYMLFGAGLAHLGYMANKPSYRPIALMLVTTVALNDVLAFTTGRLLGRRRLLPNTSPGKTVAGAVGALIGTTAIVAVASHAIFAGTRLDQAHWLIGLGVLISVAGQFGDLMLSSIKRDLGIKDMGTAIPGHGGLLDRFNSLLLVAPAAFHYIGYFVTFSDGQPQRIFTGGG